MTKGRFCLKNYSKFEHNYSYNSQSSNYIIINIKVFPLPEDFFKVIVWVYLRITKDKLLGKENKKSKSMSL